jgi:cell division protein FtsN
MISFKGILKLAIYTFIGGWMFLLGIMVGRGTSPVTFDTQQFQKRLETIAKEFGETKEPQERIDLKFYEVLDKPAEQVSAKKVSDSNEIVPIKKSNEIVPAEKVEEAPEIAVKTSKKKETYKKNLNSRPQEKETEPAAEAKTASAAKTPAKAKSNVSENKKQARPKPSPPSAPETTTTPAKGNYTIQLAAYKQFKDAVSHMSDLEAKGISSYRIKTAKDGVTWYRVRTGSFNTYAEAEQFKRKLEKSKIKSMIIKLD